MPLTGRARRGRIDVEGEPLPEGATANLELVLAGSMSIY